jgi:uncharacterized protein (DUF1810 family)
MADDPYDLARFVNAQNAGGIYDQALAELRRGRKTSHWMWFVFPQLAGLGRSAMAQRYAVSGLGESQAYLAHLVLGPRLIECATTVARTADRSAVDIFGSIDAQKLHSSMTLFAAADPDQAVFTQVLETYFGAGSDPATDQLLGRAV